MFVREFSPCSPTNDAHTYDNSGHFLVSGDHAKEAEVDNMFINTTAAEKDFLKNFY